MIIDLPIIVCGKVIRGDGREKILIKTETGIEVRLPALNEEDVDNIIRSRLNTGLHTTHFDDITIFFNKLSHFWLSKECPLRDEAARYSAMLTGYPEEIVLRDYLLFLYLFKERAEMYDQLEAELGNRWYIDEWVPSQTCLVHAVPRGLVTNILVGNIPVASTFGVYRSLIVKNNTLCKLPKRDPIGALYFALSFLEIDPEHPLTKSLSVAYWERESWQEERLLGESDAVCVWGGETAINEIKKKVKMGTKVLEYGPKRSLSLVDLTTMDPTDNLNDIALRIGHDFSVYNQEACFTSQELYLVADNDTFEKFLEHLTEAMEHYLSVYKKGQLMSDSKAHVLMTREEYLLEGDRVISTKDHGFTIIVTKDDRRVRSHPLNRTVIIHRIDRLEEAVKHITKYTQTVTLYPWKAQERLRDMIAIRGADRIVAVGMANFPRTGFPHDGIWTLNELVRWVNIERDLDFKGKYYSNTKEELIDVLFRTKKINLF
ncbi:MAG: hypothetical protein N2645_08330 [Clostridia bacterium]|nr:hypothetical protein [Clostridia bacterium]